jgi:hypothetical protein
VRCRSSEGGLDTCAPPVQQAVKHLIARGKGRAGWEASAGLAFLDEPGGASACPRGRTTRMMTRALTSRLPPHRSRASGAVSSPCSRSGSSLKTLRSAGPPELACPKSRLSTATRPHTAAEAPRQSSVHKCACALRALAWFCIPAWCRGAPVLSLGRAACTPGIACEWKQETVTMTA